ncbi:MAG: RNA-binding transcriptional accessory protein, partial [Roseivirga sp.]|nr:RNA-binding transcriptional accessory protein [Roseivirga sp.]
MMYSQLIAQELSVANKQVDATIKLLEEGGTVPFIARYRKELTGSLDEVQIAAVRDRLQQLKELDKRRDAILKSIEEQDKLTDELESKIKSAETMSVLEDIYLPYKPKRKTKASMAREKGLEPLATCILEQSSLDVEAEASKYINEEKGVANADEALKGARDIIAETVNENAEAREKMRKYFQQHATIKSKVYTGKEEEGQKYKDYFEWEEALKDAPSHRVLAMRRGESELFLMLDVLPPEEEAIGILERQFITANNAAAEQVKLAIRDAYKRLLSTSMETEMRMLSKKKADEEAIDVFAKNLHKLLMAAPLGSKRVLAIDPGFRTGCKVVCLDAQGKLLQFEAIFPNEPQKKVAESGAVIKHLVDKHNIEAIA